MQTSREPETALRLQSLLDEIGGRTAAGRRPNPPARRYALDVRSPDPDQRRLPGEADEEEALYWRGLGDYAELEWALDEASDARLEPRTVVRVRSGASGKLAWLGFVAPGGLLTPARPLPRRRPVGLKSWVDAWYGPPAEGPWMLRQLAHLTAERGGVQTLTLAACACASAAMGPAGIRAEGPSLPRALRWAESWARGGALRSDALEYALEAEEARDLVTGAAEREAADAVIYAVSIPHQSKPDGAHTSAAFAAEQAAASLKQRRGLGARDRSVEQEFAEVVRGFVSLGMALAAPE
jgi:hypothetical protein